MKKALAILLSILLLMSAVPLGVLPALSVSAATSGVTGDCTWALDGTHLTISGNGAMGNYSSKYYYDDYNYHTNAPWGWKITSVTIEEGVETIGHHAFYSANIKRLSLPNSLKTIEHSAFENSSLPSELVFPENLETIEYSAFECSTVAKVTFNGCTELGNKSFKKTSITEVDLGPISFIGSSAFEYTKLAAIDISGQDVIICSYAFDNCSNLIEVTCSGTIASMGQYVFHSSSWGSASLKSIEICGNGDALAYPYGDYNDACVAAVREAGFLCAFTTQYGRVYPGDDPYLLPRIRISHGQSLASFIAAVE